MPRVSWPDVFLGGKAKDYVQGLKLAEKLLIQGSLAEVKRINILARGQC